MHCLWLARALPFPLTAGDRIYSAGLAASLAAAGAEVVFAGLDGEGDPVPTPGVTWHRVPGGQRGRPSAVASALPLVAARHATREYRARVAQLLRERPWDAVIVDHYGMAWVSPETPGGRRPVRVFIAHNHEAAVTESQWRDSSQPLPTRLYLWQNWWKTRRLERRAARGSDVIGTITDADARQFAHYAPDVPTVVLSPGYGGARLGAREIDDATPRSIVMFGSYRWSAKQASLKIFLDKADPIMARAGVTIDVVGDISDDLRSALASRYRSARFHGYVADPSSYLSAARLAVVAEAVGGGFKLKLLEYIFRRVPIAALSACSVGLPDRVRSELLLAPDLDSLLERVVAEIDRTEALNARQNRAFAAAADAFNWTDRGRALLGAIRDAAAAPGRRARVPAQPLVAGPAVESATMVTR